MPTNVQLAHQIENLQERLNSVQASNSRLKDSLFEARENTKKLENRVRRTEELIRETR